MSTQFGFLGDKGGVQRVDNMEYSSPVPAGPHMQVEQQLEPCQLKGQ